MPRCRAGSVIAINKIDDAGAPSHLYDQFLVPLIIFAVGTAMVHCAAASLIRARLS